jgi:hypothetical protein
VCVCVCVCVCACAAAFMLILSGKDTDMTLYDTDITRM